MKDRPLPQADKLVGIPKEDVKNSQRALREHYDEEGVTPIEGLELEKNPRDLEIIALVQAGVADILGRYGRSAPAIPLERIHLLKTDGTKEYTQGRVSGGTVSWSTHAAVIDRDPSDAGFAAVLFHELIHIGSYAAVQWTKEATPRMAPYRQGFAIVSRDGQQKYFKDFDEAITQLLTKRFYTEHVLSNPQFDPDDASRFIFTRQSEMDQLNELVNTLYQAHMEEFSSREQVEDLFIRAHVNGNLLPVARLVERTLGKGSFRELGENT